jgi:predicted peptidase
MFMSKRRVFIAIVAIVMFSLIIGGNLILVHASTVKAQMPSTKKTSATLSGGGFSTNLFTDAQGHTLIYYLYIPTNYNPQKKYPLVLLMPGGGERYNPAKTAEQNRDIQLNATYARVWGSNYSAKNNPHVQQKYPSFVVIPQLLQGQQWVTASVHQGPYQQTPQPTTNLQDVKTLLGLLQTSYTGIDANRLYITGISLGSDGIWDAIERWPTYFAAAAPISGGGDPTKVADIVHLPIWDFHGSADTVVPVSGSREMIAALRADGGHPLYTEFEGAGHGVWDRVYSLDSATDPVKNFYSWLFSQKKA